MPIRRTVPYPFQRESSLAVEAAHIIRRKCDPQAAHTGTSSLGLGEAGRVLHSSLDSQS